MAYSSLVIASPRRLRRWGLVLALIAALGAGIGGPAFHVHSGHGPDVSHAHFYLGDHAHSDEDPGRVEGHTHAHVTVVAADDHGAAGPSKELGSGHHHRHGEGQPEHRHDSPAGQEEVPQKPARDAPPAQVAQLTAEPPPVLPEEEDLPEGQKDPAPAAPSTIPAPVFLFQSPPVAPVLTALPPAESLGAPQAPSAPALSLRAPARPRGPPLPSSARS